jgi:hypothetical protein
VRFYWGVLAENIDMQNVMRVTARAMFVEIVLVPARRIISANGESFTRTVDTKDS